MAASVCRRQVITRSHTQRNPCHAEVDRSVAHDRPGEVEASLPAIKFSEIAQFPGGRRNDRCQLEVRRNFHDSLLDRPHHELSLVVNPQLAHEVELVGVNGLCADS